PELENVVAKIPNALDAHSFLELAYSQTNHFPEAIRECKIVLGYDPQDVGSYLILGKSLGQSGDPQGGITALKQAISFDPDNPMAHLWLAEVYEQIGQKSEASQERAEAARLGADTAPGNTLPK